MVCRRVMYVGRVEEVVGGWVCDSTNYNSLLHILYRSHPTGICLLLCELPNGNAGGLLAGATGRQAGGGQTLNYH